MRARCLGAERGIHKIASPVSVALLLMGNLPKPFLSLFFHLFSCFVFFV